MSRSRSWAGTTTTPTARRWPTSSLRWRWGWRVFDSSVAGLGRLPLCARRDRQRGHRGRPVHARRHGHRNRREHGRLLEAAEFICGLLGRPTHSRAGRAIAAKRRREAEGCCSCMSLAPATSLALHERVHAGPRERAVPRVLSHPAGDRRLARNDARAEARNPGAGGAARALVRPELNFARQPTRALAGNAGVW